MAEARSVHFPPLWLHQPPLLNKQDSDDLLLALVAFDPLLGSLGLWPAIKASDGWLGPAVFCLQLPAPLPASVACIPAVVHQETLC